MPFPYGFNLNHVENLENGNKRPVMIFSSCSNADFDHTDNPLAWEFVKKRNGGSILSFACTSSVQLQSGSKCTRTLEGFISTHLINSYSKGIDRPGMMLTDTINKYLNDDEAMSQLYGTKN